MERTDNRLAYQGKIQAYLKEWGSEIDEWQDKVGAETQELIADLNNKRQVVRAKLAEIKEAADDRWDAFRADMDQAVSDMKACVNRARQNFD